MVKEGQLVYLQYKDKDKLYYDIGVVVSSYDQVYLILLKNAKKVRSMNYNDVKEQISDTEEGVIFLKKNGEYVISKKNLFGYYKF